MIDWLNVIIIFQRLQKKHSRTFVFYSALALIKDLSTKQTKQKEEKRNKNRSQQKLIKWENEKTKKTNRRSKGQKERPKIIETGWRIEKKKTFWKK